MAVVDNPELTSAILSFEGLCPWKNLRVISPIQIIFTFAHLQSLA